MNRLNRQRGMTIWSLSFVLAVLGISVYLVFLLLPPYMDDYKVRTTLNNLVKQSDIGTMTRDDIVTSLEKRFDIDTISHINLKQDLTVEKRGPFRIIQIHYETEIPVVGNLYFVLKFRHDKQVKADG